MTDWEPPRTVEHRETSIAFAVSLVDGFTGNRPDSGITVALESVDAEPVANRSGYHVFLDLAVDEMTLSVGGGDRYVDERRRIVIADSEDRPNADDPPDRAEAAPAAADGIETSVVSDPAEPIEIELVPTPAYEFPPTATVVRGHVEDANGDPVTGATVSLREFDPEVETTDVGEFALFVPVTAEDVRRREGRNVVVVGGGAGNGRALTDGTGTDPTLVVDHPDGTETTRQIEVAAGTRTVHYVTVE
ncbi:MAG: hypothetical protein V5A39_02205 [Haloarculaceae archaeon]